jgi:hypothetical protein
MSYQIQRPFFTVLSAPTCFYEMISQAVLDSLLS